MTQTYTTATPAADPTKCANCGDRIVRVVNGSGWNHIRDGQMIWACETQRDLDARLREHLRDLLALPYPGDPFDRTARKDWAEDRRSWKAALDDLNARSPQ